MWRSSSFAIDTFDLYALITYDTPSSKHDAIFQKTWINSLAMAAWSCILKQNSMPFLISFVFINIWQQTIRFCFWPSKHRENAPVPMKNTTIGLENNIIVHTCCWLSQYSHSLGWISYLLESHIFSNCVTDLVFKFTNFIMHILLRCFQVLKTPPIEENSIRLSNSRSW